MKGKFRLRCLWMILILFTGVMIIQLFLPFVTLSLDRMGYTLSPLQMLTGVIRIQDTAVAMPLAAKAAILLTPALSVAGLGLLLWKKTAASAGCFLVGALSAPAAMMAINTLATRFVEIGVSTVSIGYHMSLGICLIGGVLCAVLAMCTKGKEQLARSVFLVCACMSVGSVVIITCYMLAAGIPAIAEIGLVPFLFGTTWDPGSGTFGIANMILASLAGMAGAIVIGVPIGVLTAAFMAELAPQRLGKVLRPAVELLAGIPSVIYGFFGLMILVPVIRQWFPHSVGDSLLAMILILAIMVLPTIISVSETALRAVPTAYREASLALGNTRVGTIFSVCIPAAKSGILAGVILGVGRAIGETIAIVLVCGNMVNFPQLLGTVRPLTAGIVLEMGYASGLHRQALFSIGLVLFIFIMLVNVSFGILSKKGVQMHGKE